MRPALSSSPSLPPAFSLPPSCISSFSPASYSSVPASPPCCTPSSLPSCPSCPLPPPSSPFKTLVRNSLRAYACVVCAFACGATGHDAMRAAAVVASYYFCARGLAAYVHVFRRGEREGKV